ncbi:MAG: molybdenum cofactor guanylyltransferase [Synergistaceae bacterium]|nr:molybdenum cofactor guanylyltransferase [Synergistaceae bacterium]
MKRQESSAVILCGGLSRRMGTPKHELFLDRIISQLKGFKNIALSVRDYNQVTNYELPSWPDIVKDCGPLGGIYTALVMSKSEFVFVTPCDVPDINSGFIDELFANLKRDDSCLLPVINDEVQPLTGIYSVSCSEQIKEVLESKNFGVKRFLKSLNSGVHYVKFADEYKKFVRNINTPEEYESWFQELS